jgi:pyruvate dehydrogenase E1 component alpha subunit
MGVPDRDTLVRMYGTMTTIKLCDDRFRSMIGSGQLMIMYFPVRGQEVISAAMGAALQPDDYLVTTYRGLHDHIAKGVDLKSLWAEFLGKATGSCKGKGGPMHLTDRQAGVMVTTGVVGGGIPIANGLALAAQARGDGRVTVVTFGDGATSIGAFHEALNLAKGWNLPVVFLCQNNAYAEKTHFAQFQTTPTVAERSSAYGLPGVRVDGNDPVAMYTAISEAVDRARVGGGPTLVEATTYRFWGHYFGDAMQYMPAEEREAAIAADPIPRFRTWLVTEGHATETELDATETEAAVTVEEAAQFALSSPAPDEAEILRDVYAEAVTR